MRAAERLRAPFLYPAPTQRVKALPQAPQAENTGVPIPLTHSQGCSSLSGEANEEDQVTAPPSTQLIKQKCHSERGNYPYSQLWSSDSEILTRGRDHREIKSQMSVSVSLFSEACHFPRAESFHFLSGSSILGSWGEEEDSD